MFVCPVLCLKSLCQHTCLTFQLWYSTISGSCAIDKKCTCARMCRDFKITTDTLIPSLSRSNCVWPCCIPCNRVWLHLFSIWYDITLRLPQKPGLHCRRLTARQVSYYCDVGKLQTKHNAYMCMAIACAFAQVCECVMNHSFVLFTMWVSVCCKSLHCNLSVNTCSY